MFKLIRRSNMDPVTILMSALTAVDGLKALIVRKFGGSNPKLAERIDDYVQDTETFAKPAEKALRESGAALDNEVIARLMELVKQANSFKAVPAGLIGQLNAVQSNVVVVGGDVHGSLTFSSPPASRD
jgi:hypothetical protein